MLEALAGAFETDILVVVYGQMPASADEEIRAAGRKSHLKKAVSWGILTLASYLILAALERHLDLLRTRTYNFMPYMLLHTFVMPLISVGIAVSLMHALKCGRHCADSRTCHKKKLLLVGGLSAAFYMFCMLWLFVPLPLSAGAPLWIWHMSFSVFPMSCSFP